MEPASLRCHLARFAQVAAAQGAPFTPPAPSFLDDEIDDALIAATIEGGGYLLTMWEVGAIYNLYTYPDFNWAWDELSGFIDNPTPRNLERYGASATALFASLATYKGVEDTCGDAASWALAGLVPADPTLYAPPAGRPAEPPARPLGMTYSRLFGGVVVGAAATGLLAMWWRHRHGKPLTPNLPNL